MVNINIIHEGEVKLDLNHEEIIKNTIQYILKRFLKSKKYEINVLIVDNKYIRNINLKYRNIDKETDVLSFPIFEFIDGKLNEEVYIEEEYIPLGDIVISIEKAYEQAKEYGHNIEREIAFLITHAILHIIGFDHENKEQERKMFKLQEDILCELGFVR